MAITEPAAGMLLIAAPMMRDPNFWRSVVLLCEHGTQGSIGLILNRPLSMDLSELRNDLSGDELVSLGGPVQQDTLHYLHRHGDFVSRTTRIVNGVHWGGDFDAIRLLLDTKAASPGDLRFFIGYAGWMPGQLEAELGEDSWILCPAQDRFVFSEDPKDLWRTTMRSMGGEYALLANFPADPQVN